MTLGTLGGVVESVQADQQDRPPSETLQSLLARMTPIQRYHSTLYDDVKTNTNVIETRLSVGRSPHWHVPPPRNWRPPSLTVVIHDFVCTADSTFLGTVLSVNSHPIADGTFLFSDYDVRVDEIIRLPRESDRRAGETVIVTRAGGKLQLDGRAIYATIEGVPMFGVGQQYLFASRHLHTTKTFAVKGLNTFVILGGQSRALSTLAADIGDLSVRSVETSTVLGLARGARCQ